MPYKKGPNGTLRKYSSSTGRYIKDNDLSPQILNKNIIKSKVSKKKRKYMYLYSKAAKSSDPYLFDVFKYLYCNGVQDIELVNENINFPNIKKTCEVDILTKKH